MSYERPVLNPLSLSASVACCNGGGTGGNCGGPTIPTPNSGNCELIIGPVALLCWS